MADNRNFVNKFANQGGGDIFVEDAKLSEISTKTAIASEGVMLKGTDGAYYEIDKASLSEVIRAELGAILADNSKNNGTSVGKVPTLNSSGNALGASSVADLASVLGVKLGENTYSSDLNSVSLMNDKIQTTAFESNTQNRPPVTGTEQTASGVAIYIPAFVGTGGMGLQIACKYNGLECYIRVLWVGTWTVWKSVSLG